MIPPSIWHNGGKRLLRILIGISCVIFLIVAGVALGIFVLTDRVTKLQTRVEDVAGNQSAVSNRVDANTEAIKDYETAINEGWKKFQEPQSHAASSTGQLRTDPNKPGEKADVVVIPPKATRAAAARTATKAVINTQSTGRRLRLGRGGINPNLGRHLRNSLPRQFRSDLI